MVNHCLSSCTRLNEVLIGKDRYRAEKCSSNFILTHNMKTIQGKFFENLFIQIQAISVTYNGSHKTIGTLHNHHI